MRNTVKSLLALLLVSCLLLGAVGTAFAEETQESELNQLLSDIQELMAKYGPEIAPEVLNGSRVGTCRYVEKDQFKSYVAIGENSIRKNNKSYADMLAKELGISCKKLAENDLLVDQVSEKILKANAAEIKKANLITLNLSINSFIKVAINEIVGTNDGVDLDWSQYVSAEGVAEIQDTLARLKTYLVNSGVQGEIATLGSKADALVTAAESFAYGTLAYAHTLPQLLDEIHAMNPDATVVVIGMDNPLSGTTISLSSGESMDLGAYIGKLIQMTDRCAQTAAIEREYVIFTAAADAANPNDGQTLSENKLILTYLRSVKAEALPTEEGHAYIKDRILASFRKMGDVDGNGTVSYNDALKVLRASINLDVLDMDAAVVANVDGKAGITYGDALKILRASIGLDTLG